jgi:hypothetical protein
METTEDLTTDEVPVERRTASDVGVEASRTAWAEQARVALLEVAGRYNAVLTYKELGAYVQQGSGIFTSQMLHNWIGDVLGRVAVDGNSRGEPMLASLCVDANGSVGKPYLVAVAATGDELVGDADDHAARERLKCYEAFGADMPDAGGVATLTPRLSAARTRERKARAAEKPANVCPSCNMAVPATGVCDNCG